MSQKTPSPPISADITDYSWKPWFQAVYRVIKNLWADTISQFLGIGDFNQTDIYPLATLHVRSPDDTPDGDDGIIIEKDNNINTPTLRLRRTRGLNAARVSTTIGDVLGSIKFQGYYSPGINWPTGVEIQALAQDVSGTFGQKSYLVFKTSNGSTTPAFRLSLSGDGDIGVGENAVAGPANTNYQQFWLGAGGGFLYPKTGLTQVDLHITSNAMFQGNSWKYLQTGSATVMRLSGSVLDIIQEPSGTAGTSVTDGFARDPTLKVDLNKGIAIGCTPTVNPGSLHSSLWIGKNAIIQADKAASTVGSLLMAQNAYWDGSNWRYINSATASLNYQNAGNFYFYTTSAGTAGNIVAWSPAVQINATGLGIFGTPSYPLDVTHATAAARITNAWVGRMGGAASYAVFTNTSLTNNDTNYAFAQGPGGDTLINTPANIIRFRWNNVDIATMTSNIFTLSGSTSGMKISTAGQNYNLELFDTVAPGIKFNNNGGNNIGFIRQSGTALEIINSAYSAVTVRFSTYGLGTYGLMGVGPGADNTYTCGANGSRWSSVWAATGVIQTSDARLKKDVTDSPLGLDFIEQLRPVSYRWIVGRNDVIDIPPKKNKDGNDIISTDNHKMVPVPGKRIHYGMLAQDVKKVLDSTGIEDFAGWVQDNVNDPESTQSLNYGEFIAPMIKAIQELSAKVKTLEAKLNGNA